MALQNTLPDPNFKRRFDGEDHTSGTTGPGFASVKLTNDQKVLSTRTNSQRLISRAIAGQKWKVDINYNPMTQAEFNPVYAFLLDKQGPLNSFFVSLPQYRTVENSAWQTLVTELDGSGDLKNISKTNAAFSAGVSEIIFDCALANGTAVAIGADSKYPMPGELITFTDSSDATHTKAYIITTVETNAAHQSGTTNPTNNTIRINISPPLVKNVADNSVINFADQAKVKVVMTQPFSSYNLNTNNLYQFNLKLEEYL